MEITIELLNELLNRHAEALIKKKRLKINPENFVFHLEENMTNDLVMTAGNPVIIRLNLGIFADAMLEAIKSGGKSIAKMVELNNTILNCYDVGSRRMLHSLALVPYSDTIARERDMKQWHKALADSVLLLIPEKEIFYVLNLQVTAIHIPTDTRVVLDKNLTDKGPANLAEFLKVQARHNLTLLLKKKPDDTKSDLTDEGNDSGKG